MKSSRAGPIRNRQSTKNVHDEDEAEEDEVDSNEAMINMFSAMVEAQKKKKKASGRSEFQKKKLEMYDTARGQVGAMTRETLAFINEINASIEDMKIQEISIEKDLQELPALCTRRENCDRSTLSEMQTVFDDLSPRRAEQINEASEVLESLADDRHASLRRTWMDTRHHLDESLEQHRLAIEAGEIIKRWKALASC